MTCWLARFSDKPCAGRTDPVHLVPKQKLRRVIPVDELWAPEWVVEGCRYHHGQLDGYRLSVPRSSLPKRTEDAAQRVGLGWWLDRFYGPPQNG